MKGPGILWMLQTAAGLSMAGPMFIIGLAYVRDGSLVWGADLLPIVAGLGFFALGTFALFFPSWLLGRIGGPRTWIRKRLERRRSDSDDADTERSSSPIARFRGGDSDAETEQASRPLDRFRNDEEDTETEQASSPLDRFRSD